MMVNIRSLSLLSLLVLLGQFSRCQCDDHQFEYQQLAIFEMPSVNEFDLAELNLYNNLISCVANFKLQFVKCNKQLQQLARNIFRVLHENSTLGGIIKCCGVWLARDCWIRQAEEHCIEAHVIDMYKLPFKLLPKLDQWCSVYHDQTFVCLLPHYLPVTFLIISIVTTVGVLWYVGWKLKSRTRQRQQRHSGSSCSNRSRRQSNCKESSSCGEDCASAEQLNNAEPEAATATESSANENLLDQNQNISSDSH